jgi:hypothetical protein
MLCFPVGIYFNPPTIDLEDPVWGLCSVIITGSLAKDYPLEELLLVKVNFFDPALFYWLLLRVLYDSP